MAFGIQGFSRDDDDINPRYMKEFSGKWWAFDWNGPLMDMRSAQQCPTFESAVQAAALLHAEACNNGYKRFKRNNREVYVYDHFAIFNGLVDGPYFSQKEAEKNRKEDVRKYKDEINKDKGRVVCVYAVYGWAGVGYEVEEP